MSWILVTGGARGLGACVVKTLQSKGHQVVVHYRDSEKEAKELSEFTIHGNFSTAEGVERFLGEYRERFSATKGLVWNVGNYLRRSALDTSEEQWQQLFQENVHAAFALCRGLMDQLIAQKGSIITVGVAGIERRFADVYSTAYTITKGALLMLTKSLALEVASKGVRVNMVSPGWLENSETLPSSLQKIPMGRLGELEEVARLVDFLMDENNAYMTGQNIEVAGGVRL